MYLVDTNVWLERLLDGAHSAEVGSFLEHSASHQRLITDFAFHSSGVVTTTLNRSGALLSFVRDAFVDGDVRLVHLDPHDTRRVVSAIQQFRLDFDDAYQYAAAEKHDLTLVSFDSDVDRTGRGTKTPAELRQS